MAGEIKRPKMAPKPSEERMRKFQEFINAALKRNK